MTPIENAKVNGAELIAALVKTGTGDQHLKAARKVLDYLYRTHNRVATANDIIDALESAGVTDALADYPRTPKLTIEKARAIAETGEWNPQAKVKALTVEERILAGQKLPEPPAPSPVEQMAAEEKHPFAVNEAEEKDSLGLKTKRGPGRPPKNAVVSDRPRPAETATA